MYSLSSTSMSSKLKEFFYFKLIFFTSNIFSYKNHSHATMFKHKKTQLFFYAHYSMVDRTLD